jgi:hypothetical protein
MKRMRMMSVRGDDELACWDPATVSEERLAEIEREFNKKMAEGFFAADLTDGKNTLIKEFDKNADILLSPRVCGG